MARRPSIFTSVTLILLIGGALTVVLNPEAEEKAEQWLSQINKQLGLEKLGELKSPTREYIQAALIVLIIITACWGNVTKCFRRGQPVSADDKSIEAKRAKGKARSGADTKDADVEAGGVVDSNDASLGGVNGVVDGLGAGVIAVFNSAGAVVLKHGGEAGQQVHDQIMQAKENVLLAADSAKRSAVSAKQYTTEVIIPSATQKATDGIAYLKARPKVTYGISACVITVGCLATLHAQGHLDLQFLENYHISYDYTSLQDNLELGLLIILTFFVFGVKSPGDFFAKVKAKLLDLSGQKPAGEGGEAGDGAGSAPFDFKAVALGLKQKAVDKVVLARDKVVFAVESSKIIPDVKLFFSMAVVAITRKPLKSMLKVAIIAVQSFATFKLLSTSISLWSGYTYAVLVAALVALHAFPFDPWDDEYEGGDGKIQESTKRLVQWTVALCVALFLPAMFYGKIPSEA